MMGPQSNLIFSLCPAKLRLAKAVGEEVGPLAYFYSDSLR